MAAIQFVVLIIGVDVCLRVRLAPENIACAGYSVTWQQRLGLSCVNVDKIR